MHLPAFAAARACLLVTLLAATAGHAGAQDGVVATTAPAVLRLPASTRAMAMGDAHVAVADAEAIFYNPAQLVSARGVAASVQRYGNASTLGTVAVAIPFAPGGLGIGVQYLDYGAGCTLCAAAVPANEAALTLRGAAPTSAMAATIGFARTLFGVRVGLAGKYVEQRASLARDGLIAADVGFGYTLGPVALGLAARNLGGRVALAGERWELPRSVTAGAAFSGLPFGPLDIAATAALSLRVDRVVSTGAGIEVGYTPLEGYTIAGRLGIRTIPGGGASPFSLGGAFTRDRIAIEYAFQPFDGPGDAHRIGIRLREQ